MDSLFFQITFLTYPNKIFALILDVAYSIGLFDKQLNNNTINLL